MNSDPQFWTNFREAAQAAPKRVPTTAQWEALKQNLPRAQHRFPWLVWMLVNLLGLACLNTVSNFIQAPLHPFPLATATTSSPVSQETAEALSPPLPPSTLHPVSPFPQPTSSTTSPIPTVEPRPQHANPYALATAATASSPVKSTFLVLAHDSTTARKSQLISPLPSGIPPIPVSFAPPSPPPTTNSPQKTRSPYLSLGIHFNPFTNFDGRQGPQPSLSLTTTLARKFRAHFRLSQVQTSRQWTDFSTVSINEFRDQAPGLLLDATQSDKALVLSAAISRPLLSGPGRWQITSLAGAAIALQSRSSIELLSFTAYGSPQPATLTPLDKQQSFQYWSSFIGLDVHYRLTKRFDLVLGSRYLLSSPQLPASRQAVFQTGLSYRIR